MPTTMLKRMQPSVATKMHSFGATCLCLLLGVAIMGHLISGQVILKGDSFCSTCPNSLDPAAQESFTVRNALPMADQNLYMVCSFTDECGKLTVQPPIDVSCKGSEVIVDESSTCACSSASKPKTHQILCEFVWTRSGNEDEIFWRAQVLVWSRGGQAPQKTYYRVDQNGFWFTNSTEGQLTNIGTWVAWNYLSKEQPLKGGNAKFPTLGQTHCRTAVSY